MGAILSSIPGRRTRFFSSPKGTDRLCGPPASYLIYATGSCLVVRWPWRDHLHLMPRLIMSGAVPLLPLYIVEPCTKTTLLLLYFLYIVLSLYPVDLSLTTLTRTRKNARKVPSPIAVNIKHVRFDFQKSLTSWPTHLRASRSSQTIHV